MAKGDKEYIKNITLLHKVMKLKLKHLEKFWIVNIIDRPFEMLEKWNPLYYWEDYSKHWLYAD